VNYEFYARHNKELITEVEYTNHPVSQNFAERMLKGSNQVWMYSFKGQEVKDWLNYQKGYQCIHRYLSGERRHTELLLVFPGARWHWNVLIFSTTGRRN
jgi:hypothetical protein